LLNDDLSVEIWEVGAERGISRKFSMVGDIALIRRLASFAPVWTWVGDEDMIGHVSTGFYLILSPPDANLDGESAEALRIPQASVESLLG
jgi:hypothetical protein